MSVKTDTGNETNTVEQVGDFAEKFDKIDSFTRQLTGKDLVTFITSQDNYNISDDLCLNLIDSSRSVFDDNGNIKTKYKDELKELTKCTYKSDTRSVEEYAQELFRGWLIEDGFIEHLNNHNCNAVRNGKDKQREFLSDTNTDSDILLVGNEVSVHVEIISAFGGYYYNTKKADLRDKKFDAWDEDSLLVGIDLEHSKFFVCSNKDEMETKDTMCWGKPSTEVNLSNTNFVDESEFIDEIQNGLWKVVG